MRQREHSEDLGPNTPRRKRPVAASFDECDDLDTPVESFVRALAVDLALDLDTPADYRTHRQLLRLSFGRRPRDSPSTERLSSTPVPSTASPRWCWPATVPGLPTALRSDG